MKFLVILSILGYASAFFQSNHDRAITFSEVFEKCPSSMFETQDFDPEWPSKFGFAFNATYYVPIASRGDLFRVTQQFYGKNDFEVIKESHLRDSCFRLKNNEPTGMSRTLFGYNGKKFIKNLIPVQGMHKTVAYPAPFPGNFGATIQISLSDNRSYILLVLCHGDGLGSWAALSPYKFGLHDGDIRVIKAHIRALGFRDDNIIELDYSNDNCDNHNRDVPV